MAKSFAPRFGVFVVVLVVLVGSALLCPPRIAASSDQKLSQIRVPTPPARSADLPDALTQLAYKLKVPIGWESCGAGERPQSRIAVNNPGARHGVGPRPLTRGIY
jgi:hypothetical protein